MVIIFIIILVIVFFFLFFSRRQRRNNFQNIIKANELKTNQILDPQPNPVFIGEESERDFITYNTQFMFKINDNQYLNNGVGCSVRNSKTSCLNKESEVVTEAVLNQITTDNNSKKYVNENAKTADFKFIEADRMKSKYVSYGAPVLIQNIGNTKSYLSLCLDKPTTIFKYGIVSDVFFYNNINDALKNGRWIIIPKYNNGKGISFNNTKYNFYEDYNLEKLRSLNIPVKLTDKFLIINENKLNGKTIYLNLLGTEEYNFTVECDKKKYEVCVGLSSITEDYLNPLIQRKRTNEYETVTSPSDDKTVVTSAVRISLYEWSIEPLEYDVTVYDTLLVDGSIKLGTGDDTYEITTDTLKYIKSIPFHFKDRICIKPTKDMIGNSQDSLKETDFKCIGKPELEMLNGSRPINIKSTVSAKPFVLYSRPEFQGRSLRIGFNYVDKENLPFFEYNRFLNKGDDGKWKSLFIDGKYIAIIFNKPDYGYGGSETDLTVTLDQITAEQDAMLKGEEVSANNQVTQVESKNNNNNSEDGVKGLFEIVRPPGIENVLALGDDWKDGIRSIQFVTMPDGDAYELKCLEKINFKNDIDKRGKKKYSNNIYTANTCVNGNKEQQFYLTNKYDNMPDKDFTLSKLYDDLEISHIHFHRHKFDDKHN